MLGTMVMARLDPSPWNLGAPLLVLAACGPLVPFDDGGTDSSASASTSDDEGPNPSSTSPSGPNPTGPNPTTVSTSTVQCYGDQDCPPNYRCQDGYCYYEGYCKDGTCCSPECGWYYECFSNAECPAGYACTYNQCNPVAAESDCSLVALDFQIPIALEGGVLSLAFVDGNGDAARDLLIGQAGAVQHVDGATQMITTIDAGSVYPQDIAAGDLDADGDDDVVVVDGSVGGGMRVLLHDDGWTPLEIGESAQNLAQVALADIEADGFPDIYGRSESNGTFVAFNSGPGSIDSAQYVFDPATSMAIGNLDDDGFDDAVIHNYSTYALLNGTAFSLYGLAEQTGRERRVVAVGNFNGSSPDDVITLQAVNGVGLASLFAGFAPETSPYLSWWQVPVERAVTVDVNADGYDDVVGSAYGYPLAIAYGSPLDQIDVINCVQYVDPPIPVALFAVGDMTGDGRPDVAVSDGAQVIVLAQNG
jgi:hypothetical protein